MPPVKPHAGVWGALLSACRTHSNVELGEVAAQRLLKIEPDNAGNYMLLSNIYAKACRWEDVGKVRALMRRHRMRKLPGCSWIQVGNSTQKFFTGDIWDQKLWEALELLGAELKDRGYLLCREYREDID
ncbi:putative pentatricopeptide repeat-containing protein [Cinnamomum micranthum f. kanehirae]|uniref:Putative pentatricopeptide repeat-containing protein n=1 Tax=Cinnamomum micranthum f. kanehirae TaxID=337451 RepID=A0A443NMT2_9MAGN|nr:putative pentatricopeptide repeat-containing protein [Cinnamomum micranthum f. kanehirae]